MKKRKIEIRLAHRLNGYKRLLNNNSVNPESQYTKPGSRNPKKG